MEEGRNGIDSEVRGGRGKRREGDGSGCVVSGAEHVESNVEGRREELKGWI